MASAVITKPSEQSSDLTSLYQESRTLQKAPATAESVARMQQLATIFKARLDALHVDGSKYTKVEREQLNEITDAVKSVHLILSISTTKKLLNPDPSKILITAHL